MRLRPDDDVYAARSVWLGPVGYTFPWVARYLAYGVWLCLFVGVLAVELLTPLPMGLPPVWELSGSILATYVLMQLVDVEVPLRALVGTAQGMIPAGRRRERPERARVTL